ncbi:lysostaphin resistance A-like protein [Kytococcus sedentarius]|uniref:CPBP family intramembrane glutamic endopeptidase n=1 Tax=Kytococcus sedentarius TaxID=1276 RepID=UPI0035BBE004
MTERTPGGIGGFLIVTFGWAWAWWAASILLLREDPASPLAVVTTFLGTCAPAVAAWTTWYRAAGARDAWRRLGRCVAPSGPWAAWVAPSLAILAAAGVASWTQRMWGDPVPASPSPWLVVPQLLVMLVAGGGQEEIGWRGWLQPAVRARTGRWIAPLLVGAVWFCWHLPLWWTPGSIQTHVPLAAFAMVLIGLSLLMARAMEATRGRPAVAIWLHAVNNLAAGWLAFVALAADATQVGSWMAGAGYLAVGVAAMLIRPPAGGHQRGAQRTAGRTDEKGPAVWRGPSAPWWS